jgi:hypothetical protein
LLISRAQSKSSLKFFRSSCRDLLRNHIGLRQVLDLGTADRTVRTLPSPLPA